MRCTPFLTATTSATERSARADTERSHEVRLKKSDQQQLWTEAQRRCRLTDEAVQMAKELGISPRSLIKNIPSPKQQWKAPVEDWVRDIYEKRYGAKAHRSSRSGDTTSPLAEREP